MSTSLRVSDMADVIKLLTQTTAQTAPDDPSEVLNDFVSGTVSPDDVAVADTVAFPNFGHSGTYKWSTSPARWNLAQWS